MGVLERVPFGEPGPPLVVLWGTNVTLTLIAHDSAPHNWFIDYNNDLSASPENRLARFQTTRSGDCRLAFCRRPDR